MKAEMRMAVVIGEWRMENGGEPWSVPCCCHLCLGCPAARPWRLLLASRRLTSWRPTLKAAQSTVNGTMQCSDAVFLSILFALSAAAAAASRRC